MFTLRRNWYLPQLHEARKKKKKVWCSPSITFSFFLPPLSPSLSISPSYYLSESHLLSLLHTLFLFHDPRVLFQRQSITYSTSSTLSRLQSEHCALACSRSYLPPSLSPSPPHPRLLPHFLVSLHLQSAFPYLRFALWLADKYHFGGPPQVAAFSFPGRNDFSAYLQCQWSYRTFQGYSADSHLLHRYSERVRRSSHLWRKVF